MVERRTSYLKVAKFNPPLRRIFSHLSNVEWLVSGFLFILNCSSSLLFALLIALCSTFLMLSEWFHLVFVFFKLKLPSLLLVIFSTSVGNIGKIDKNL